LLQKLNHKEYLKLLNWLYLHNLVWIKRKPTQTRLYRKTCSNSNQIKLLTFQLFWPQQNHHFMSVYLINTPSILIFFRKLHWLYKIFGWEFNICCYFYIHNIHFYFLKSLETSFTNHPWPALAEDKTDTSYVLWQCIYIV
jgi:hypothetical protein